MANKHTSIQDAQVVIYSHGSRLPNGPSSEPAYKFDVSQFRDPMGQKSFKALDGRNKTVQEWLWEDPKVGAIVETCLLLTVTLIDVNKETWFSVLFEELHGQWISPAVAEIVAKRLEECNFKVSVVHYGLLSIGR